MKKRMIVVLVIVFYLCSASFTYAEPTYTAQNSDDPNLDDSVDEIIDNIDLSELEAYLATIEDGQSVIGVGGIRQRIKDAVSGNLSVDYRSFAAYIADLLGSNVLALLPTISLIIAIAVAYNLLSSLRGKFASESVQNIVYFACVALVLVILLTQIFVMINSVRKVIASLQKQMNMVFPILLTLMTAIGAGSSVSVYKPGVAILANGIAELVTVIILPLFIITVVMTAIGNLSDGVKLGKFSDFFSTASKWLLGTSFFVFSAFLAVQGITASVYDSVSVRAAKFAISKYVPIIGGYLSDGLNLVMSGSVLVKNAVGITGVILLFVSVLPVIIQIVVFGLGLRFAGAVVEPLGDGRMSNLITDLGKRIITLVAIVLAVAFLYFVFLVLIVCTGNLAV